MLVRDYISCVIEINNYHKEFPPVVTGRNATKLPDKELLDLLEFGIPIKWQRKIQVQNFEPTAGTLHDFQDFCKRLEATLNDPPADNKSNKMSGQEKGTKKHYCNNNNKHKKGCKNGSRKNTKHRYNPRKEQIHALAAFTKEQLKAQ